MTQIMFKWLLHKHFFYLKNIPYCTFHECVHVKYSTTRSYAKRLANPPKQWLAQEFFPNCYQYLKWPPRINLGGDMHVICSRF